jgi:hypothetical protein
LLRQLESVASLPNPPDPLPEYYALTATFPAGKEPKIDALFGEDHDLIVPTRGAWDPTAPPSLFPIRPERLKDLGDSTNHHHLLKTDTARTHLLKWLGVP